MMPHCHAPEPVALGPMFSETWTRDPKKVGIALARYKFVGQMLRGKVAVAEIGAGDGFGAAVVAQLVGVPVWLYDRDPLWPSETGRRLDIVAEPLPTLYEAIYMLDVIEHITPKDEPAAFANIKASLRPGGVFIVGSPSLESQAYASDISKRAHVNCKSGERVRADLQKHFGNVFLFGMNDEVVHVGFLSMCHYLIAICTEAK